MRRLPLASLAVLGAATALTGCAASAMADEQVIDVGGAADLADGQYSATGDYVAPSGPESVDVTLTLVDGVVTELSVKGNATDPEAKQYEAKFVSGIDALVVGKSITSLNVTNVAGSSLTSSGFAAAISDIVQQAGQ